MHYVIYVYIYIPYKIAAYVCITLDAIFYKPFPVLIYFSAL